MIKYQLNFLSFYSNALVLLNKTNRRFDHSTVAIISVMVIFDTSKQFVSNITITLMMATVEWSKRLFVLFNKTSAFE